MASIMAETVTTDTIRARDKQAEDRAVCKKYNLKTNETETAFDVRTRTDRKLNHKQGRLYDSFHAQKPGGIRVDEIIYGLKMAHLSCTDDSEERLRNYRANTLRALEKLVGGPKPEVTSRLPLSKILEECFDLNLNCWIDKSGFNKGRPFDTQGFIASNDDTIVLSYRFTTSLCDWFADFCHTKCEYKTQLDSEKGFHSRGRERWCTKLWNLNKSSSRPRVNAAFYNYFICTIPEIRKHIIQPLLREDKGAKPKKIYVVGSSLGAAVSQIAWCFILDELYEHLKDPDFQRVDRLISVTAGCPRVGDQTFRKRIQEKMTVLRPLDRAVICRLVHNIDIVPHGPLNLFKFCHLSKMVYITKDGKHFIINPDLSKDFTKWGEIKTIFATMKRKTKIGTENESARGKAAFENECEARREIIVNHMPYWYMFYMDKLKEEQNKMIG